MLAQSQYYFITYETPVYKLNDFNFLSGIHWFLPLHLPYNCSRFREDGKSHYPSILWVHLRENWNLESTDHFLPVHQCVQLKWDTLFWPTALYVSCEYIWQPK